MAENKGFSADETIQMGDGISQKDVDFTKDGPFEAPYAGMPAHMVRHYSQQPLYVWIRRGLLLGLLAVSATLLGISISTVVRSAPCLEDWQEAPVYQVYPRSFKDSDGDGLGDLRGIMSKLDYIADLGVGTVWLNPIMDSPQADMGYDVSDYKNIYPPFGSMNDFQDLLDAMHQKGLKLLMDLVPNHTSNNHTWFLASEDPNHPEHETYRDYYVWRDANSDDRGCEAYNSTWSPVYNLPNNWVSCFGGSAWEWSDKRQQFYYHAFLKEQPDLNYDNQRVRDAMVDVVDFWFDKGVDGFRIDAVGYMFEADHLRDEPVVDSSMLNSQGTYCATVNSTHGDLYHDYTMNMVGMHEVLELLRSKALEYSAEPGVDKLMITESYDFSVSSINRYYGTSQSLEASFPFNFWLLQYTIDNDAQQDWDGEFIAANVIESWLAGPKSNAFYTDREWPNFVVGNHDNKRLVTRVGPTFSKALAVLLLTLPGTPTLYYGDEIGMEDVDVASDDVDQGGEGRDKARSPMQWDDSKWAGFQPDDESLWDDSYTPWNGAVGDNKDTVNVEAQIDDSNSLLNTYKALLSMRNENPQLYRGWYCRHDDLMRDTYVQSSGFGLYAFTREQPDLPDGFLIMVNVKETDMSIDLANSVRKGARISCSNIVHVDENSICEGNRLTLKGHGYVIARYQVESQSGKMYQHEYKRTLDKEYQNCFISRAVDIKGGIDYSVGDNYWTGNDETCKHEISEDGSLGDVRCAKYEPATGNV